MANCQSGGTTMRKRWIFFCNICLLLTFVLPVFAQDDVFVPPLGWWDTCPTPQNLPDTIEIGAVLALSGPIAVYGDSQQAGIQLAIDEMNDFGYLGDGVRLNVVYRDSAATPEQTREIMTEFAEDETILAVIGPTLSTEAFQADPIAQDAGLVVLGISNTAVGITDMGDYIFRNSLPEAVVIPGVLEQVLEYYDIEDVIMMYDGKDSFTRNGATIFRNALDNNDIRVILEYVFMTSDQNFVGHVPYLVRLQPDAFVVSALADEAILAINAIRDAGFTGPIIGGNGFNAPAILLQTDVNSEGIIAGAAWNRENPRNNDISDWFVENYQLAYMTQPDQFAAQAYTGAWLIGTAIRCADSTERSAIRDALAQIQNFESPLGLFSFDENRDPIHPPVAQIVRDGAYVVLTDATASE
ncbi:MAG: ABC transporter substrate-binding protein [Phototrophicales bacterium]|nr:MAG: ABC transporter substrate-binding protein [Phototrophicales bacterium]